MAFLYLIPQHDVSLVVQSQCYNIAITCFEKTLHEDCEGHFLTAPGSVQLQLTDIIDFFGDYVHL